MGEDAVPLILRELQSEPDAWIWAIRSITEADPVSDIDRGNGEAMARAWLEWGTKQGYSW